MQRKKKQRLEYRYYELPTGLPVLALLGERWVRCYGMPDPDMLHFHNYLEIGFCYEGTGELVLDENYIPFSPNMLSVIPPSYPHTTNSAKGTLSRWEYLFVDTESFLKSVFANDPPLAEALISKIYKTAFFVSVEENEALCELVLNILDEIRASREYYEQSVKGLLLTLLIEIARTNSLDVEKAQLDRRQTSVMANALDYVSTHYRDALKISELADVCHMSEANFRRRFFDTMRVTPLEYINRVRVGMACGMLKTTDDSIAQIAQNCGFGSIASFNRNFRRVVGAAPLKWRNDPAHYERRLLDYSISTLQGWD